MSLTGFVNRWSNYCQIDIRKLKEPRRCSRLRRLLTGKSLERERQFRREKGNLRGCPSKNRPQAQFRVKINFA